MGDLKNPRLIWAKGLMFVLLGCLAGATLIVRAHDLQVTLLLLLTIWAFCRAYYFAFYVIERYVDPTYKFAGLSSFLYYLISSDKRSPRSD